MRVQVEFTLIPMGGSHHVSKEIALCEKILRKYNLTTELHALGTNIEGEFSEIMKAIEECHEAVHDSGRVRVYSVLKIVSSTEGESRFADKVKHVEEELKGLP